MRNWNKNSGSSCEPRIEFTSYLWGIETINKRWPFCTLIRSHLTYEELKLKLWFCNAIKLNSVHILPMRNWNMKAGPDKIDAMTKVHILPMRNWNLNMFLRTVFKAIGSHLTYEELKLFSSEQLFSTRVHVHILPMRNWNVEKKVNGIKKKFGSHLTYEELKPEYEKEPQNDGNFVHILPMRNWNIQPPHTHRHIHSGSHLTYEELKLIRSSSVLSAQISSSHLTYEELKLILQ